MKSRFALLLSALLCATALAQTQPVVTSFTPTSGWASYPVDIYGSGLTNVSGINGASMVGPSGTFTMAVQHISDSHIQIDMPTAPMGDFQSPITLTTTDSPPLTVTTLLPFTYTIVQGLTISNQAANSETLTWTNDPNRSGRTYIDGYNIVRNGTQIANVHWNATPTYDDTTATNAEADSFNFGPPTYSYSVNVVDASNVTRISYPNYWMYWEGTKNFPGDFSDVTVSYTDTSVAPINGGASVIAITANGSGGCNEYFQPFTGSPGADLYALDVGAFNYVEVALQPTVNGTTWSVGLFSRVPPGDIYPYSNGYVTLPQSGQPASVAGQWAIYKFPLSGVQVGFTSFTASIVGNLMTVTSAPTGVSIEPAMWVTGTGIPANTYIMANGTGATGSGGIGTYTLSNSATVAAETVNGQRTDAYKFYFCADTPSNTAANYYIDFLGFTTN